MFIAVLKFGSVVGLKRTTKKSGGRNTKYCVWVSTHALSIFKSIKIKNYYVYRYTEAIAYEQTAANKQFETLNERKPIKVGTDDDDDDFRIQIRG